MSPEQTPRVSILIAARDAQETLPAALKSVARQRFSCWECVVVDDGSQEETAAVVASFAQADPRFHLLQTPAQGVVRARTHGLGHCQGELVALLDADDLMHRDRLSSQIQALEENPTWSGVGSWVRYFPRRKVGAGRLAYEQWLNQARTPAEIAQERFLEMPLGHPTLLLRREALSHFAWRDAGWPEDWDLLLRMFAEGHDLGVVPRVLHAWRLSAQSLSKQSPAFALDAFTRCRAAFLANGPLAQGPNYDLVGYGSTGKALRKALHRQDKTCRHIYDLHPRRLGQIIDGAEVLHRDQIALGPQNPPLLVSVAGRAAREQLRTFLVGRALVEGRDFWLVA